MDGSSDEMIHGSFRLNYLFKDNVGFGRQHPKKDLLPPIVELTWQDVINDYKCPAPTEFDYIHLMDYVWNQGLFSCGVSNTVAAAVRLLNNIANENRYNINKLFGINKVENVKMSRLRNYWEARLIENNIGTQDPIMIESSLLAIKRRGLCDENYWEYIPENISVQPDLESDYRAFNYSSKYNYNKLSYDVNLIKFELYNGRPVILAIALFEDYDKSPHGLITIPENITGNNVIGWHTLLLIGYKQNKRCFIFQNSFGSGWKNNGIGYIEYEYILDERLCGDIYSLKFR